MRRRLSDEESALLARALADVKPLKARRRQALATKGAPSPPVKGPREKVEREERGPGAGAPPPHPSAAQMRARASSAFTAGDPRIETKARRGRIAIERILDLHGLRQDTAHARLSRFIEAAQRDDCRCVLIVTGKGAPADSLSRLADPAPRGVIRRRFLEWIEEAPLRARIARVGRAAPRHGGAGAFYVFLKGRRREPIRRPS